ncbi:glycoside hydrolase family 43 protein [Bombilactobacillus thymidiniphilus]|uniref:Glycoside hydrolase family 43 protein n=1 Tax=Bombilactobacillus thymidiniphilus TaxID=2923363 RepID=A0ABY4PBR4_9LACO|nr:glycoside hydrolase family 43 protein [Bombilactobacillus thymidiniphilus]UQS83108.1 glycoside hydrolase family 43 protein [Bombilactobacillus thymidiniphilus]
MKQKKIWRLGLLLLFGGLIFGGSRQMKVYADLYHPQRVAVHDPSIFRDPKSNEFYIFGSHQAQAKSNNLLDWTPMFKQEYEQPSQIFTNYDQELKPMFDWAGHNDGDTAGGNYAIWAPDVVWNAQYRWNDGTKGAYMYYFSTSSSWIRSVIGYAVSKNVEGPYHYVDSVIYSGFTKTGQKQAPSTKSTAYQQTNVASLIKQGKISGFNNKWVRGNGYYNNDYAPNAIDVNVTTDKNGQMYLAYGSWSGGIFILPLNAQTGQAIYPGKDSTNAAGQNVDRYFGTHLIGGYHESGEAPYIKYDPKTDYYYLFTTYGGLFSNGGYNMRLFRSKTIDGKYVDSNGKQPIYTKEANSDVTKQDNQQYGVKMMGNYDFNCLPSAYMSPGHNSAYLDNDQTMYIVNHTRFNNGAENHEVRVHQTIMNQDNWPVSLPFEYTGHELQIDRSNQQKIINQIPGTYEFVNNNTQTQVTAIPKAQVTLDAQHQVKGALTGTWSVHSNGYQQLQMEIVSANGQHYTGQFKLQQDESAQRNNVLVFAAMGNNEVIWGSKLYNK